MMVIFVILSILNISFASVENCTKEKHEEIALDLGIPNCISNDKLKPENQHPAPTTVLCNSCKKDFLKKYPDFKPLSNEERKEKFLAVAFNEYQKNLTENLVELTKMRSLQSTGSNFTASIESCKQKSIEDYAKDCESPSALKILRDKNLLEQLQTRFTNELVNIISTDQRISPKDSLLERTPKLCSLSEKDALLITSNAIEDALSPEIIDAILKIDLKKENISTFEDLFMMDSVSELYDGDISELSNSLKSHPILGNLSKSPNSLINFLKSIKDPKNTQNLRASIYNNVSGNTFDKNLASNCDESFKALKKAICSKDFENGNIGLDGINNFNKINNRNFLQSKNQLADSDLLIKDNADVILLCDPTNKSTNLDLTNLNASINKNLNPKYASQSLKQFRENKYQDTFASTSKLICESQPDKCKTKFTCAIAKGYSDLNKRDSRVFRLANSSNESINSVLRSMIGNTNNIPKTTINFLIDNGILPKQDGTIVAQPDIPERRPAEYASAIQKQSSQTRTASALSPSSSSNQAYNQNQASSDDYRSSSDFNTSGPSSSSQTASSEALDKLRDQEKELRNVQNEIRRRLSNLPNNKPSTLSQAKQIAADSYQSQGMSYTPEELNRAASEMMAPAPTHQTVINQTSFRPTQQTQSGTSGSESAAQKFRNEAGNRALMGMAGAQQSELNDNKNAPSQQSEGSLRKVALHLADDPKVNLSETLSKKLDPNDPETKVIKELLKKQSNFLLQMKSVNFKVVFTDNNNFNLLLESGDKKEAERIRPQLEIFLNKIKRNNTLHNLSQSWST